MKKLSIFTLALLMIATMVACNYSTPSSTQDASIAAIQEHIDQVMQSEEMKSSIEYCKANNMDHHLEARKDTLVYKYSYTVEIPANAKELLHAQYKLYEDTLAALAEVVKVEEPAVKTVVWEYYSIDGNLIFSFSF